VSAPNANVDPEAALDRLVDEGVVDEAADGTLTTTEAYEQTRVVYQDTYGGADEETVVTALSEMFDVDPEAVATYVAEHDVDAEDLVAYLSLQSFLDPAPERETLATMAALVVEVDPGSPVPGQLVELDDDDYESFLSRNPDAVVTVWKTGCRPCDSMKADLDEILERVPDGVAVAGVDGESVPSFRLAYGVDSAPAVLAFEGGELVESLTGQRSPVALGQFFSVVYGVEDVDPVTAVEAELGVDDGGVDALDGTDADADE
jgi:thiol-disulfide isomerase/thioredoxin